MDSDETGVGRFVTSHPVDNRRRWIRGGIALACTILGALLLAGFIASGEAPSRLPAVALLLVVIGAPIAVNQVGTGSRGRIRLVECGCTPWSSCSSPAL